MKIFLKTWLFTAGILLMLILFISWYLPGFLSLDKPVNSKNILIESWISSGQVEQAVQYSKNDPGIRFFLIGKKYEYEPQIFRLSTVIKKEILTLQSPDVSILANATLFLTLPQAIRLTDNDQVRITVIAKGEKAAGHFARINLILNGEHAGGYFTNDSYTEYQYKIAPDAGDIQSVAIRFNNDLTTDTSDRNLFINSLHVDDQEFELSKLSPRITRELSQLTTGFTSESAELADYLISLGVDPSLITILDFHAKNRNLTLAGAREIAALRTFDTLRSVNIVTSPWHSRRSLFTYKKIIPEIEAGVVCFPVSEPGFLKKTYLIADEYLSYLGVWFTLTFLPLPAN